MIVGGDLSSPKVENVPQKTYLEKIYLGIFKGIRV